MNEFQNQTPMTEETTFEPAFDQAAPVKKLDTTKILIIALIAVLVLVNIISIFFVAGGKKGTLGEVKASSETIETTKQSFTFFDNNELNIISIEGKYGYMDNDGEIVIQPTFDSADEFVNGVAKVGMENKDGEMKYALIDTDGEYLVTLGTYESIGYFNAGLAVVSKKIDKENIRYGYIDTDGEEVIPCDLYRAGKMSDDGYAYVITAAKEHAVIDTDGDTVLVIEGVESFNGYEIYDICAKSDCTKEANEDSRYCSEHDD